jgi:acyl dehydratase
MYPTTHGDNVNLEEGRMMSPVVSGDRVVTRSRSNGEGSSSASGPSCTRSRTRTETGNRSGDNNNNGKFRHCKVAQSTPHLGT